MTKHTMRLRRGHCTRCGRPATVEVVYQRLAEGGPVGEPVAERRCDRHRRPTGEGLTMQTRTLTSVTVGAGHPETVAAPAATGHGPRRWRRMFPGHRQPWTPLSVLADRPSGTAWTER